MSLQSVTGQEATSTLAHTQVYMYANELESSFNLGTRVDTADLLLLLHLASSA
jgi:hypothetical protein